MIHVCFALYDKSGRYAKFTGTTMLSLFDNTSSEITVHILHDNTLTNDNRSKFIYLAGRCGQYVNFYNVENLCAEKIADMDSLSDKFKAQYSLAAMYRFLIPQILPPTIDKVIYLDSDIIVNLDVEELWRIRIIGKPLAAVAVAIQNANTKNGIDRAKKMFRMCRDGGVKAEDYFNSGVLLMNLRFFRDEEKTLTDAIKSITEHPEYEFIDQDVLNYCFAARALKLPVKFNRAVRYGRLEDKGEVERNIYHYAGQNFAWSVNLDMKDPFNRLWMDYFIKTPWFGVDSVGRLYESVQRLHISLKSAMINISALMSGKTRAFFVLPENLSATKEVFKVTNEEEIFLAESKESLIKLLDVMRDSNGKKIFFIMVNNFPFNELTKAGFVQGKDFLNGFELLSEANGFPLDSLKLIKAM